MNWYVILFDVNRRDFIKYNVFNNSHFFRDIEQLMKEKDLTWKDISERVSNFARYSFWSRCEYEMVLNSWPDFGIGKKVDVLWQLEINWNNFIDYIYAEYRRVNYGQ